MKRNIFLSSLFILTFSGTQILASHIVGGEMNYRYLGNSQYQITLTVYRDCINGQAPFDDPAVIGFYSESGLLINVAQASISLQHSVPNAINSPCLDPPTNICYEVAQYIFTTNIPSGNGAVTLAYQRCCRNYSIMNMANVQSTGATYMAVITDPLIAPVNSNPVFNEWPPTFICKDAPFTFDHSATDADGDSLVYEMSYPYEGGSLTNRAPNPPDPPPYTPITFLNPYSLNDPLGGIPMTINPSTGILKATPVSIGQYVYGISVKEYRNGVYLGETRRDFQVNVVPCPQLTVASILSPTIACGSLDAHFISNSFHAATYKWDFGDSTSTADSSSLRNPVYTYPDTGDYMATLIAYSPESPLCNDTTVGVVHVYPLFLTNYYYSNVHCSDSFAFSDMSYGINGSANFWSWNFGDNNFSSDKNPFHIYNSPGEYNVRLISSVDSGCVDTLVKKIRVLRNPESDFSISLDTCTYTIQTINSSSYAVSYRWEFGDWGIDYTRNDSHIYANSGDYDVRLIVSTDSVCTDSSIVHVSIPPLPVVDFNYNVLQCDSDVQFYNLSRNAIKYIWDFGDNESSTIDAPSHTYSLSGFVPVWLTGISAYGCETKLYKPIFFISKKDAYFDAALDTCSGLVNFKDVTNNAAYYLWEFGDGSTSQEKNPVHRYSDDGKHNVRLTINGESECSDSMEKEVNYESPLGEKVFVPNTFTPNGDGINDYFSVSIFRPCDFYSITIFNRWGQMVFESDDATNIHWDGTFNGERLPEDIYVYLIENNGNRREGILSILR